MPTTKDYNAFGEELERSLLLKSHAIAFKLLENEEDIPEGAVRPSSEWCEHYALCQVFALNRRQGKHLVMLKEDHWCWAPLVGLGLVDVPEGSKVYRLIVNKIFVEDQQKAENYFNHCFPRLEYGKYIGHVSAPLITANFEPDLVIIYANVFQLLNILLAIKFKTASLIDSQFDPIDSCVFSTIPVIKNGKYRITLPDPGEHERAMTGEDEIIFTVPASKMEELMVGLRDLHDLKIGYRYFARQLTPDFPQPDFYQELFKLWGICK